MNFWSIGGLKCVPLCYLSFRALKIIGPFRLWFVLSAAEVYRIESLTQKDLLNGGRQEWGAGGPRRLGLRPKPRDGFAARMLLGAPPHPPLGAPAPAPLPNGVWGGASAGVWGGAPSYILAAKPPRGLGRSPNRRAPPAPTPGGPVNLSVLDSRYDKPPQQIVQTKDEKGL